MVKNPLQVDMDSMGRVMQADGLEALKNDLYGGLHARAVVAGINQQNATRRFEGARVGNLFTTTHVFDPYDFHFMNLMEEGCWTDNSFVRERGRDVPDCVVKYAQKTNSIVVPAKYADVRKAAAAA